MNMNIHNLECNTAFAENIWSAQFKIKDKNIFPQYFCKLQKLAPLRVAHMLGSICWNIL